jgi:hypothetical protein
MSRIIRFLLHGLTGVLFVPLLVLGQGDPGFSGKWTLVPEKSTEIDLYATLSLEIQRNASTVTIIQTWGSGRSFTDTLRLKTDGSVNQLPVRDRVWPTNVFMGISMQKGASEQVQAGWEKGGMLLKVQRSYTVLASQGKERISSVETYQLSDDRETLTLKINRSTRETGPEVAYVLKRSGTKEAYFMKLGDNWEIGGKLPEQAFLISLQGVVNTDAPRLYFLYPDDWPFTYPRSVFEFYKNQRDYTFTELRTSEEALRTLKDYVKGYVIWDKSVRTSLIVAFTVAGLEKAIVVSQEMVPMVESFGLKPVADFRGKFTGQTDAQIYKWAYDQYWSRCSKEFVIWLGGEAGKIMKPAVADFGICKQVFFTDLSTKPEDVEEYALSKKIFSEMKPLSMVMGWHSYAKDKERDFVKLTSNYALRVEGLNTLPNMSFSYQVPASHGFKFKNNHHQVPGKTYTPEKKVYISCIQTDGIGLGAWLKPGRGEIPYAWEVTMNWVWMAPSMLEYFYSMATPNDYFIGCLSGPGYMYPKAIPPRYLPEVVEKAKDLMKQLDLDVFEIMDYSEGATVEGNTELTREVVDAYYKGMPDVTGFVNGYAPAFTFTVKDGKPLISYDYYLSPTRPEADAVADLQELASINAKRPYFLLVHVREWSDIKRVKGILSKLTSEFEVVPLDIFLRMAGQESTYQERFLKR